MYCVPSRCCAKYRELEAQLQRVKLCSAAPMGWGCVNRQKAGGDWNKLLRQWNVTRDAFKRHKQCPSAVEVNDILNAFFASDVLSHLQAVVDRQTQATKAAAAQRQEQDSVALKKMSEVNASRVSQHDHSCPLKVSWLCPWIWLAGSQQDIGAGEGSAAGTGAAGAGSAS